MQKATTENDLTTLKGMALGMIGVALFSVTLPATRVAVVDLSPLFISLGRAAGAGLLGGFLLLVLRQPIPSRHDFVQLALVSLGVVFGFPYFSSIAMESVPASHGGVVLGILPLTTAIAGALAGGERPGTGFWVAALVGSGIVSGFSLMKGGGSIQAADIWLMLSIICASGGYATGGILARKLGGWQVICWALVIGLPFSVPPFAYELTTQTVSSSSRVWIAFAYLVICSQFLGFFAWNRGLAMAGVARVGMTQLTQPFLTLVVAAFMFSEVVEITEIAAAIAVFSVVAISKKLTIR